MIAGKRCPWSDSSELYRNYHDKEWGVPVHDEKKHFEFILLESSQAGLSWITILKKRDNYRTAFDDFDYEKIALYDETKVLQLMENTGIIRNERKIRASITNAQAFVRIQKEFGSFDRYIWGFVNFRPVINYFETLSEIPVKTELSDKISADMKKRGFTFFGSVICYAHMQAIGIVNDHLTCCFRHQELSEKFNF
ncbi:MAG: DNA-3-methyladenine glycosylase I [Petrotogaceae bacterium]|nr:DNA-3-methyladenine glycosylase I [Petrotogaceae bacterium]